jgi:hypothetical protein
MSLRSAGFALWAWLFASMLRVTDAAAAEDGACNVAPQAACTGPIDCGAVDAIERSVLDEVLPNNRFQLVTRVQAAGVFSSKDPSQTFAAGVHAGWSPLERQSFRVSLGLDVSLGRWVPEEDRVLTLDPRLLFTIGNEEAVPTVPMAFFIGPVAPVWTAGGYAVGGGVGISLRPGNLILLELSGEVEQEVEPPATREEALRFYRFGVSAGFDWFAQLGVARRSPPKQKYADLRCVVLGAAWETFERDGGGERAPSAPPYCESVRAFLRSGRTGPACSADSCDASCEPLAGLWSAMGDAGRELRRRSEALWSCARHAAETQRQCLSCQAGKTLETWLEYSVDPFQVAAALGCAGATRDERGVLAAAALCDPSLAKDAVDAEARLCKSAPNDRP